MSVVNVAKLGDLCLLRTRTGRVKISAVKAEILSKGFSEDSLPKISDDGAFRRALDEFCKKKLAGFVLSRVTLRNDVTVAAEQIVRLRADDTENFSALVHKGSKAEKVATVVFRKDIYKKKSYTETELLSFEGSSEDENRFFALFQECRETYTGDDLRIVAIRELEKLHSFSVGSRAWFVPADKTDRAAELETVLQNVGADLIRIPQFEDAGVVAGFSRVAEDSLGSEIDGMLSAVNEMLAKPPARSSTITRQFEEIDELRDKIFCLSQILQIAQSDLQEKFETVVRAASGLHVK